MNESNQRGTPPLKLSFFPFFLSLLLSRKKKRRRATTSRETTEEVRARRGSRARAIPRRLKLERASRHRRCCCCCLLFNAKILDAQFFFVSSFNGNYPTNFYQFLTTKPFFFHSRALLWRQKKRRRFLWPWTKVLSFALHRK